MNVQDVMKQLGGLADEHGPDVLQAEVLVECDDLCYSLEDDGIRYEDGCVVIGG